MVERMWYITVKSVSEPDRDAWIITVPKSEALGGQHIRSLNEDLRVMAESGNRKWAEGRLKYHNKRTETGSA